MKKTITLKYPQVRGIIKEFKELTEGYKLNGTCSQTVENGCKWFLIHCDESSFDRYDRNFDAYSFFPVVKVK